MVPEKKIDIPRLSVVMSVFNGGQHLAEAVESILSQTFKDFEFIIIDDGSEDNTWEILSDYSRGDSRIVLRRNERNLGLTRSLNKGLSLCRGEYIARMDADDISLPGRFESQIKFLDANPNVGVLGGGFQVIDEKGDLLFELMPPCGDAALKAELLIKNNALGHSAIMARTGLLRKVGGYDESLPYAQDYDLWYRLCPLSEFASLPINLVKWRHRKGSISTLKRRSQLQCIFEISRRIITEKLKGKPFDTRAYQRLWWAYHGYCEMVRPGDVALLDSLWNLLETKAGLMQKTAAEFRELGYNLLSCQRRKDGFELLRISEKRLGQKISRLRILKFLLKPYLRKVLKARGASSENKNRADSCE